MSRYYLEDGKFVIEDYNRTYPFADFLPSISGPWGVPLWAFFVNRGQAMISFGLEDKDHSIGEFYPANKAYQATPELGFRTFVKINNREVYEPFQLSRDPRVKQRLLITSYDVSLQEHNPSIGLNFSVNYFTLPNMPFGGLVRVLTVQRISGAKKNIAVIDGLPRIIPFGSRDLFLKHLSRTLEAWMNSGIEKIGKREYAFFKLNVNPQDVAATQYIEGANFQYGFCAQGKKNILPRSIVDPQTVFAEDTSQKFPVAFSSRGFRYPAAQQMCGRTPCAFQYFTTSLQKKEKISLYTVVGGVFHKENLPKLLKQINVSTLEAKRHENRALIGNLKSNALSVSNIPKFDEYIQCSYLDNILRGGYPFVFNHEKIYYLYSRKHGDLERDYNKFKLLASYFSEGEGNYRDVNQNRRMDLFFNPAIAKKNVVYFLNLIRLDGYNPLVVRGEKLYIPKRSLCQELLKQYKIPRDSDVCAFLQKGFYLGEFFRLLDSKGIILSASVRQKFLTSLFEIAECEPQADFGEGFWVDHWRYNLDLIESFLMFYPDREKELFFNTSYMFWDDEYKVRRRSERYLVQDGKVVQLNAVRAIPHKQEVLHHRKRFRNFLRTKSGKGALYQTNLAEKLLSLVLTKYATLDFDGIGIEMEADKPGWCDSLNGLPALFGSSICETFELKRTALLLKRGLKRKKPAAQVKICHEMHTFFAALEKLQRAIGKMPRSKRDMAWWDKASSAKEEFRMKVFWGIAGPQNTITVARLTEFLDAMIEHLDRGVKKAKDKKTQAYYTYFTYEIQTYQNGHKRSIVPRKVKRKALPFFLEGPVHALRVEKSGDIPRAVKKTPLYDRELKMYRLNASLKSAPLDIGRSRAFPPGWLENESIWLHMEYKYLLELLKAGLYSEFYKDFFNCGVCFFDPARYGKSFLENSSFIVSSAFPDKKLWGKGFVARLTGATSELLNIWIVMCLGFKPFYTDAENNLYFSPRPLLNAEFFTRKRGSLTVDGRQITLPPHSFACKLFSRILLVYHNRSRKDTYRKDIAIDRIEVIADKGSSHLTRNPFLSPPWSYRIRQGGVRQIHVYLT